jgi:hypothetical protein
MLRGSCASDSMDSYKYSFLQVLLEILISSLPRSSLPPDPPCPPLITHIRFLCLNTHSTCKMIATKLMITAAAFGLASASIVEEDWTLGLLKRQAPGTPAYACHEACGMSKFPPSPTIPKMPKNSSCLFHRYKGSLT